MARRGEIFSEGKTDGGKRAIYIIMRTEEQNTDISTGRVM